MDKKIPSHPSGVHLLIMLPMTLSWSISSYPYRGKSLSENAQKTTKLKISNYAITPYRAHEGPKMNLSALPAAAMTNQFI